MCQSVEKGSDPVIRRRTILKSDSRFDSKNCIFLHLKYGHNDVLWKCIFDCF